MPIQKSRSLHAIQDSFQEYGFQHGQEGDDSSSTGTVQRHPQRSLSLGSSEPEKLPLRVRNRNLSENQPLSSSSSVYTSPENEKPELTIKRHRSGPLLGDPNINIAVRDSIRLAKKRSSLPVQSVFNEVSSENERPRAKNPLERWVKTLHRRNIKRQRALKPREERWHLDEFDGTPGSSNHNNHVKVVKGHKKSSSWASSGFVTAVKSATVSLTTMSIAAPSKTQSSTLARESIESSRRTPSLDHSTTAGNPDGQRLVDEASMERAYRRGNIISEIIRTEESYVADLRLLIDVYRTISMRSTSHNTARIVRNINEILDLHEILLVSIRPILAYSAPHPHLRSYSDEVTAFKRDFVARPCGRRSLDVTKKRSRLEDGIPGDPMDAAKIAQAFNELIGGLFVYEEYGSRFAAMMHQMAMSEKFHDMESFEKGFEALANTIAPCSMRDANRKKGLTYKDLLMKPVQRVTKYPLLFSDLLSQTPVIDCPQSCNDVETVLYRLRETVDEINKATNDEYAHERIQRSWKLQDLISFPTISDPFTVRSLGHAKLCGVLHAAYQSPMGVTGEYMLCALFKSCLILATRSKHNEKKKSFDIVATISLANLEIHNCDNETGLQCYTALFSWKIIFEADQQLYEIIFSACSRHEENQWRTMLRYQSDKETRLLFEDIPRTEDRYSRLFFSPSIQPFGEAFGQPGTLARQLSTRRPATVGARTSLGQVIIRNTHTLRNGDRSPSESIISRSQTVHSATRVPTLAPRRWDRVHMEQDLAEVWTRELLPYPGMSHRGESQVRASANSVMRRLSRATSNSFGKRSVSFTGSSIGKFYEESEIADDVDSLSRAEPRYGLLPLLESPASSTVAPDILSQPDFPRKIQSEISPCFLTTTDASYSTSTLEEVKKSERERPRLLRKHWNSSLSLIRTMSFEGMKAVFSHKENHGE